MLKNNNMGWDGRVFNIKPCSMNYTRMCRVYHADMPHHICMHGVQGQQGNTCANAMIRLMIQNPRWSKHRMII